MTDFMAKMRQIRFQLGLRPRPRWGSLQRSPRPLAGFGGLLLREGEERGEEGSVGHMNIRDPQLFSYAGWK